MSPNFLVEVLPDGFGLSKAVQQFDGWRFAAPQPGGEFKIYVDETKVRGDQIELTSAVLEGSVDPLGRDDKVCQRDVPPGHFAVIPLSDRDVVLESIMPIVDREKREGLSLAVSVLVVATM